MANTKKSRWFRQAVGTATFALTAFALTLGAGVSAAQTSSDGKTEVNVGVTELTDDNISFEVPLYYVMCVTQDANTKKATVTLPAKEYAITNTSGSTQRVAVTSLGVSGVAGGGWSLVATEGELSAAEKKIYMTVGQIPLPAVTAGTTTRQDMDTSASTNTFYDGTAYTAMAPYDRAAPDDSRIVIPVTAQVSPDYQVAKDGKTVAQFRLYYRVSPLNADGEVLRAQ